MAAQATPTTVTSMTSLNVTAMTSPNYKEEVVQANSAINTFMPWLLILAGCVCNVFIVLGMRTRSFRSLSTAVYMTVNAVNDLLSLVVLLIPHWLHLNFPQTIVRDSAGAHGLCKFFNFYGWAQADLGIMLTSSMTLDRAHVILRPMTYVDLVKRAKIVVAVSVLVVVAKDFHFWFSSEIVALERKDRLCDVVYTSHAYHIFYTRYWPVLDTIFVTVCFVIMLSSNCVIIAHVRKQRKQGTQICTGEQTRRGSIPSIMQMGGIGGIGGGGDMTESEMRRTSSTMTIHSPNYDSVTNQVTRMLLCESILFVLLSYPFSLHLIATSQIDDLQLDPAKAKVNALAFNVVFYLLFANKCVNFLVYCLSGKRFRKAIAEEVFCLRRFRTLLTCSQGTLTLDSDTAQRSRIQRMYNQRTRTHSEANLQGHQASERSRSQSAPNLRSLQELKASAQGQKTYRR